MTPPRLTLLVCAAALALAAAGPAVGGVEVSARDVPVPEQVRAPAASGLRVLPAQTAPHRFNLVGIHWRGPGDVSFRTAPAGGPWSPWRPARPEDEDGPNRASREARATSGWKVGNPYWTGAARRLQVRVSGRVTRVKIHYLRSPLRGAPAARTVAAPARPALVSRAGWGANEKIVRAKPSIAPRLAFAVVHHTAGARPTSPSQSAAIVRGIQTYHVRSNGWNDIGYNFLVDPFGQIFVGRKGPAKNVVGAHAQGFNTGSTGIAVLGTYTGTGITAKARAALTSLLAWRLDLAHVDPTSRLTWTSAGSPKWKAGTKVSLNAVSGHRDLGLTSCPGTRLYGELGGLAKASRAHGGAKVFGPRVTGSLGGPVRFTARLSSSLAWTVRVLDAAGKVVASGTGTGAGVDWTWSSAGTPSGVYTYTISAGNARAARGAVPGSAPPLALTALAAAPRVVTPNGDGKADVQRVSVTVTRSASLDLLLRTPEGAPVATLAAGRPLAAGTTTIEWGDKAADGTVVPDGRYTLVAEATAGSEQASRELPVRVDRTLGWLTAKPSPFSPNGDGRRDEARVGFTLAREARVYARVMSGSTVVATLFRGTAPAGPVELPWKGRRDGGGRVPDGTLRAVVDATGPLGTRRLQQKLVLDTTPPVVRILSARRVPGGTQLRLRLSERTQLSVRIGGQTIRATRNAGARKVRLPVRASALSVSSLDPAGNAGKTVHARVTG